jgi:hypothetical protein
MLFLVFPLRVQLAFYAFCLILPTSAIMTFSVLSGLAIPTGLYVAGVAATCVLFWAFLQFMSLFLTMSAKPL